MEPEVIAKFFLSACDANWRFALLEQQTAESYTNFVANAPLQPTAQFLFESQEDRRHLFTEQLTSKKNPVASPDL